jgi:hypothetical protein
MPRDWNQMLRTHRDTPSGSLARVCAHRGTSLGLVAAITLTDNAGPQPTSYLLRGLMDEPCHLATSMVVLGTFTRWRGHPPSRWFVRSMLFSSVLIDLDHLPLVFESADLTTSPRPFPHAFWLPVVLGAGAVLTDQRFRASGSAGATTAATIAAGAAWGVASHFLRDVGTASIRLWRPVSSADVRVPASWYLAGLLILATLPSRRQRQTASR